MTNFEIDNPIYIKKGVSLLTSFHSESAYSKIPLSELKLKNFLLRHVESELSIVIFIIKDGEPIGLMIGTISWYFFSEEKIAEDLILYVIKEHRGAMSVLRAVKKYISWAKEQNVAEISIATSVRIREDKIGKLYERLGFEKVGEIYKITC
jgi:RimJ/RimL family protein N-acetyltransferase